MSQGDACKCGARLSEAVGSGLAGLSHALVAAGETSFHRQRSRVLICQHNALCSCITLHSKIMHQLGRLCRCLREAKTSGWEVKNPVFQQVSAARHLPSCICLMPTVFDGCFIYTLSNMQMKDRFLSLIQLKIWVLGKHNASYNIRDICYSFKGFGFLVGSFSWNRAKLVPEGGCYLVSILVFRTSRVSRDMDSWE